MRHGATRTGGAGETRQSRRSWTRRRRRCCGSGSGSWSRGHWRARWRTSNCRRPSRCRRHWRRRWERTQSSARTRTDCGTPAGAATSTWRGCAAAASRRRPTRSSCRPTPRFCAGSSTSAPARASPWFRSAAAAALSAGSSRCAAPISASSASTWRRCATSAVDRRSLTARLGAGLRGPEAEAALGSEGLTLGHFPQSFEYATIGGFAATRSAGQASSGYGRFDALGQLGSLDRARPARWRRWKRRTRPPGRRCGS